MANADVVQLQPTILPLTNIPRSLLNPFQSNQTAFGLPFQPIKGSHCAAGFTPSKAIANSSATCCLFAAVCRTPLQQLISLLKNFFPPFGKVTIFVFPILPSIIQSNTLKNVRIRWNNLTPDKKGWLRSYPTVKNYFHWG